MGTDINRDLKESVRVRVCVCFIFSDLNFVSFSRRTWWTCSTVTCCAFQKTTRWNITSTMACLGLRWLSVQLTPKSWHRFCSFHTYCLFSSFQLSYIAEDENGKIVGYVLAKMWVFMFRFWTSIPSICFLTSHRVKVDNTPWAGLQAITEHTHTLGQFGVSIKPKRVFLVWILQRKQTHVDTGKTCKPHTERFDWDSQPPATFLLWGWAIM